ncbi:peptidoglycan-binding protein [Streptomyces sp. NBC_01239]|uniref:peptidoglycan-binding domain-containing protein n=1 Tax=Streptomyces sp. NBC_01239 TaxID=2903792 RepID=UPI00225712C6|nr:peptidoglycan-binding protein [Streptomyces sp. NBC_01239]MCX4810753.1 peptidoglycan-binding protein [Streptomyces sp. NBC_01239]
MNEAKGHICPQCDAPRAADGSPSCTCTQQAADALRDTRTAEAAAAEDFDPLRIRPYVELDGEAGPSAGSGTPGAPEGTAGTAGATGDAGETQRLPAVEETMLLRAVPPVSAPQQETSVLPTLRPPSDTTPNATDLSLFEDGGSGEGGDWTPGAPTGEGDQNAPRRRRTKLLAVAGAVVAVTAVAGFASGLFSYEPPSRDDAAPQDVRASVPTESENTTSATPSTSGSTSAEPTTASPTPSLSETPSPTVSSTPSATPSKSTNPSHTPTPTATASTAAANNHQSSSTPTPVLQRGDEGPEVTELQLRLTQLRLYTGPDNGIFDKQVQTSVRTYQLARGITSDGLGVYGTTTRSRLESETSQP